MPTALALGRFISVKQTHVRLNTSQKCQKFVTLQRHGTEYCRKRKYRIPESLRITFAGGAGEK